MKAKWMAVLAIALLFSGCASKEKPRIQKVGKDVFFVEVEEFDLTNAEVQELEGASSGKVVVLQDYDSKAETTIQLSKGKYKVIVYLLGPSEDEDAFYLKAGSSAEERLYPEEQGGIQPTVNSVDLTQEADGSCNILLTFGEPNVQLDRVEFKRVP